MTALQLFVEKGYHDTKITDIAAAVPMSTGLMFHYFESKEDLLLALVRMGAESTRALSYGPAAEAMASVPPDKFLEGFLAKLFSFAKEQPWVFNMFVLMGQVRRPGMPEEACKAANEVDSIEFTAGLIRAGQKSGVFRKGDASLMSRCFWASVQGIMEEMALDKDMKAPDPAWIVGMLR